MKARQALTVAAAAAVLGTAAPASAQMQTPQWIEDVNWHATLGTGVALETGGVQPLDPWLLYFGGDVSKSWRWWYGLTFKASADFYTEIVDYPMVPYKLDAVGSLALGAPVFQMVIARADLISEFGGIGSGYSTGTNFRLQAATLPSFAGDLTIDDRHILSYMVAPLHFVIGQYDADTQQGAARPSGCGEQGTCGFSWDPYTAGRLGIQERFIVTEWAQLHGGMTFFKAWANSEIRFLVNLGVVLGILENAVQFGLDVLHDHWKTPSGYTENVATFTLSARLRI